MEDTEKKKRKMIRTLNPNDYRMETKNSPEDWPGRCTAGQEESGYDSQSPLQVEPKQCFPQDMGARSRAWHLGFRLGSGGPRGPGSPHTQHTRGGPW